MKLVVLGTETAAGFQNIADIPCVPRVDALTWGAEDLSAALGARRNRGPDGKYLPLFEQARTACMISAAAAGVQPLDTVFVDVTDPDALRQDCLDGAWIGFTGKISIHPSPDRGDQRGLHAFRRGHRSSEGSPRRAGGATGAGADGVPVRGADGGRAPLHPGSADPRSGRRAGRSHGLRRSPGLRPFDPGRLPFYYGWVVLAAGTIGMLASFPGQTAGVSVFTEHLTEATGLDRLALATAYLLGTTTSGLVLSAAGRWIDLVGSRVVAFAATIGLAVTITAFSFVGPMSATTGLIVMTIGFGFLRFFGQGLLTLASRTMIAQWFDRRRGLVSSVSSAAFAFVFSLTPALLFALIELSGFRWAWRQIAIGLVVVLGALVLMLYRNRPEDCGLTIDTGAPLSVIATTTTTAAVDVRRERTQPASDATALDATRAEAIRDRRFWIVTLPIFSMSAVGTAITFHIVDLGAEVGLDEATIVRIFVPVAVLSIPVTLVGGWLADVVPVLGLAVAMAVLQIAMYLSVGELGDPVWQIVAIVSWGGSSGLQAVLMAAALPRLFGRTNLGAIAGAQMSTLVIGSALGPFFFAWVQSTAGTYQRALVLSLVGPVASLLLAASGGRWWRRASP